MTKADIVARMAAASGWPKAGTERALRAALGGIRASLKPGDAVTPARFEPSLESNAVHPGLMLAVLAVTIAALVPFAATAQSARPAVDGRPPVLTAEAVLLLDPEGKTLFAKNPEEERAPASLVKLMTLYLAFE